MHGAASGIEGRRTIGVRGDTSKRTAMVHARRSTAGAGINVDRRSVGGDRRTGVGRPMNCVRHGCHDVERRKVGRMADDNGEASMRRIAWIRETLVLQRCPRGTVVDVATVAAHSLARWWGWASERAESGIVDLTCRGPANFQCGRNDEKREKKNGRRSYKGSNQAPTSHHRAVVPVMLGSALPTDGSVQDRDCPSRLPGSHDGSIDHAITHQSIMLQGKTDHVLQCKQGRPE
ncbi:hypothetical protein BC826DRAFT_976590 [Russula brevipes]|nr:hypothetical protein BC826DRAFT_976590 [Russula brevipes]